ncbi:MAG: hypothetical protein P4L79_07765 [Legionella sp.]|uniref:hypothetical protein n=1 Tax=Legionella sp. TaxID=459 RepID=UPI00283EAB5E|nr:hypothetical protein [Legionella sp.]
MVDKNTGSKFIVGVCDYFTWLELPEIQEILLKHKNMPEGAELNIWQPYQKTRIEVYEPYKQHPELFEKTFAHFYKFDEWQDVPIFLFVMPKTIKAMWQMYKYRNRLERIHNRLPILLKNKEQPIISKPIVKRLEFSETKSILYLNQIEIRINRHGSITDQHRILAFMFKHDNLSKEFFYSEMAEEIYGEPYDNEPRKYWDACELINEKVADDTKGRFPKFLLATLEKSGLVKINPECWALFR